MFGFSDYRPILLVVGFAIVAAAAQFTLKWRRQRAFYKNVPCPPHDFWLGHLKLIGEASKELPPDIHPQQLMTYIGEKYNMPLVFYLDLWPISYPLMLVQDPTTAATIVQTHNLPRHEVVAKFLGPMVGDKSVFAAHGPEWKRLRTILNPGFAPQYLITLVPALNKHIAKFKGKLDKFAGNGETCRVLRLAIPLTFDIITEVVLGFDLDTQGKENDLSYNFRKAVEWAWPTQNPVTHALSRPPMWWFARQQDRIITRIIREQHAVTTGEGRAAINLFFNAYNEQRVGTNSKKTNPRQLDPQFVEIAAENMKTLLLGGHDTTAGTLSYTLGLLSQNPEALTKLRSEHDAVFGNDTSQTPALHDAEPTLLNKLPYTTAVIKESMRISSPSSTTRGTTPAHIQTVSFEGEDLPLTGQQIWILAIAMGRKSEIWTDPHAFRPERFMPGQDQPKDAWRGFEKGPRACLGLELAMIELRLLLVHLCRDYEFNMAFRSDDLEAPKSFGGHMYQVLEFSAKPKDGMPMKVIKRVVKS